MIDSEAQCFRIQLTKLERVNRTGVQGRTGVQSRMSVQGLASAKRKPEMEFHVALDIREKCLFDDKLFSSSGNVVFANFYATRLFASKLNAELDISVHPEKAIKAGQLNAMGLIDEILHYVISLYREQVGQDCFTRAIKSLEASIGKKEIDELLITFINRFPPEAVYKKVVSKEAWLAASSENVSNRELALEELTMLYLANANPAFAPFDILFDDSELQTLKAYPLAMKGLEEFFKKEPVFGPDEQSLIEMLKSPMIAAPYSLKDQLEYIRKHWGLIITTFLKRMLSSFDFIKEEEKPYFPGPGPSRVYVYEGMDHEYERFSPDKDWMPCVIMMAKSTLVWLSQLSITYNRPITRLDQIPDEELDSLARRGFTSLWLIGLWERSEASKRIKQICGNPEAAASAYSLYNYTIAQELGGEEALNNLQERCNWRGIKLASDMVPNHTGMYSEWISKYPDRFVQVSYPPFPGYSFSGENLSSDPSVGVFLEDHYYSRTDASVVFKRHDFKNGNTRYIYHGNDGTGMPWNDTAQIDFLNPEAREAVIQEILHVARQFQVIRFDAAMVLAKKHIERLWYPEPGSGGDIPSRADHALSKKDFDAAIPNEFWREVVDRCAKEVPDTLLLAEAFWMLEGYFVRTLGMHRVYNSAFMNMLKREENAKYRSTIKNTQEFDKEILKRFVNFMNNPDEDTAVAQFGKGDKYIGVCTMMVTMPGLPMFGHGQIEGFEEKYGMEYRKAYWAEKNDEALVDRHEKEVFPLMKKRHLFANVNNFLLFDFYTDSGSVNENVFAYSNRTDTEAALVLFNNSFEQTWGTIHKSAAFAEKKENGDKELVQKSLAVGLGLHAEDDYFVLLREQRSGLWYIRPSRQIYSEGLRIVLKGYESQVFLNVHEIKDTELKQYKILCSTLNGRGVVDISNAMQDIFLKDLYSAFSNFFSCELINSVDQYITNAFVKDTKKASKKAALQLTSASILKSIEANAIWFFKTAQSFLDGTTLYEPFILNKKAEKRSLENAFELFSRELTLFFALIDRSSKKARTAEEKEVSSNTIEDYFSSLFLNTPWASKIAAAFVVLDSLRNILSELSGGIDTVGLINHWCLDRKAREALEDCGMRGDAAYHAMSLIKTLISFDDMPVAENNPSLYAFDIISHYTKDESIRALIGLNVWDGVTWFNKERFDEFVQFACLFRCLRQGRQIELITEKRSKARIMVQKLFKRSSKIKVLETLVSEKDLQKRMNFVWKVFVVVRDAEAASEYKLEKLLDNLKEKN